MEWGRRAGRLFRILFLLIIVLILLQIVHLALLHRLDVKQQQKLLQAYRLQSRDRNRFQDDWRRMKRQVQSPHVIDSAGKYYVINFLVEPSQVIRNRSNNTLDLHLATHTSFSRLFHLVDLQRTFDGPISIAVFTLIDQVPILMQTIVALRLCFVAIRRYTSFHVVFPLTAASVNLTDIPMSMQSIDCDSLLVQFVRPVKYEAAKKVYGERPGVAYPNNLMRNVARFNVPSMAFVLVLDIDLLPSIRLRSEFRRLVQNWSSSRYEKTAFVLPTFESNAFDVDDIACNKTTLLKQWANGQVRPFYFELCRKCHVNTDYQRWMSLDQDNKLNVAYEVLWNDAWEPFYIAFNSKQLPPYDERFKQYGFNRISQVCEAHVVGYRYLVLNQAFLVHRGWKVPGGFHADKDIELEHNRMLFRQFKNELKTKHPESKRRC